MKRPLSISRSSLSHSDDVPHTTDPVFELDEDRVTEKGQLQGDSEKSEESSPGPSTPSPTTPVLTGLSSPPKGELANRVASILSEDGPRFGLGHNPPPPTSAPIPTRVTHTRGTSRSALGTPTGLNDAPVTVPHSAPPDNTSHASKLWNKLTKPGSNRGKKLNAALDKTGTLVRVMSAGFSSKPKI